MALTKMAIEQVESYGKKNFVDSCLNILHWMYYWPRGGSDDLWGAKQELKERIAENHPEIFPKEDVELCIDNEIEPYPHHLSCPFCGKPSEQLHWIHFCSPPQTWRDMCGREGALSICTNCGWQIEFICEIMN